MSCAIQVVLVSVCLLATGTPVAAAADDAPAYAMTVWAPETGASPGDVFAITQDLEGYLWLGTQAGLVRFDGSRFVRWPAAGTPIPGPVMAVVAARDGSLWVGSGAGAFRVTRDGVRRFTAVDGFAGGVTALAEDRQGAIWAGNRRGLFRYADGRWALMGAASGYGGAEVFSLHEDQSGSLWVGGAAGVYRKDKTVFEVIDAGLTNVQGFAEDDTSAMWVTDSNDAVRQLTPRGQPTYAATIRRPASGWRLLHDRRGQIWVAALGGGLLRVRASGGHTPVVERVEYEHRMAGSTRSLYEDREGNIWVGMRSGLLRLSEALFTTNIPLDGLTTDGVRTTAVSGDGSVWVATWHSVNRFSGAKRTTYALPQTLALHSDQHDVMWASTSQGLWKLVDGRSVAVPVPGQINWARVLSITTDASDVVWLCSTLKGVMAWDGAVLSTLDDESELAGRSCSTVYRDRRGRVWIGFNGGGAAVYDRGAIHAFGEREGFAPGAVVAITEDRSGAIWLTTSTGLNRLQNGRLTAITQTQAPLADVVPTLVEDDEGFLWLGVNAGGALIRFHPREIDRLAANPAAQLEYATYDSSDGLPGPINWQNGVSGVRAGDGRLWVAAGLGVATIDPRTRPRNRPAAPPRIDTVSADGRAVVPTADRVLPSRTSTLRIEYGAISLSSASKLRFRYMLEGLKDEWVPMGSSREVAFNDLPAGDYRFRVSSTYDGQWSDAANWRFSIAPALYRTSWFLTVVAFGLAGTLAAAWWLRLRAVRGQYALVFAERARVSREIHDTLLQSLAAIGVELETIAVQLDPAHDPARDGLRRLRRQVGHCLREARESILDLRRNPMKSRTLVESLRDLAGAVSAGSGVATEFMTTGGKFAGSAEQEIQLFRIAQEAVGNAIKHGRATSVQIVLDSNDGRIVLTVSDNGRGFAADESDTSPSMGEHLGLQSMRERAERIRGRLAIASELGHGTTIEVTVPVSRE
jgi:signal transduction histidine kinase/ligand-binding sensor domain-containing protein